jgi:hypothetical protein
MVCVRAAARLRSPQFGEWDSELGLKVALWLGLGSQFLISHTLNALLPPTACRP